MNHHHRSAHPGKVVISNSTVLLLRVITAATGISDGFDLGVINGVSMILAKNLSHSTISFFVAVMPAMVAIGAFLGAYLADRFGRKKILIGSYSLLIVGPALMAIPSGSSLVLLFTGRAVVGLGVGVGGVAGTVYMAEISPTKKRGSLVGQEAVFLSFGLLLGYLANYLLIDAENNYHVMLGLGCVIPSICLVSLLLVSKWLPESPHWERLMQMRNGTAAEQQTLSDNEQASTSVSSAATTADETNWNFDDKRSVVKKFFASPGCFSAVLVGVLQPLCGVGPIIYFSDLTFTQSETLAHTATQSDPYIAMSSIYIGLTKMAVLMVSALILMDHVGRRTLLLISSALLVGAMSFVSLILFRAPEKKALLLAAFCTAIGAYAFGWNCVLSVYPSELLATNVRTFGLSFVTVLGRCITVINSFLYPIVGLKYTAAWFTAFAVINAVSFVLVYLFAVETFNKPLILKTHHGSRSTSAVYVSDRDDFVHHTDAEVEYPPSAAKKMAHKSD